MSALLPPLLVAAAATGVGLASLWGTLALYYMHRRRTPAALVLAAAFAALGVLTLAALLGAFAPAAALALFLAAFTAVCLAYGRVRACNARDWKTPVAVLPYATRRGERVTVHNVRNFSYRTTEDYTVAYYDRSFDLAALTTLDLIASYWMGGSVAHVLLSFGFGAQGQLAVSIERRDERGASYSTLRGLFRNYELIYVVADERDVIRLRTSVRTQPAEEVYLYRVRAGARDVRRLFLEYLRAINALCEKPEFYNTLTANCTANVWLHARVLGRRLPYSWKILLSGYVPEYLYQHGGLDTGLPFARLRELSRINDLARALGPDADFSRDLRAALAARRAAADPSALTRPATLG